jgi:hypothetical protein
MDPAMLQMMMGQQKKPEPWSKEKVGYAVAGALIVGAVGTYVWDSRGAPFFGIHDVKQALFHHGYDVSGLPIAIPIINSYFKL